jgi:hypothetical protein
VLKLPPDRKELVERIGLGACVLATLLGVWLHLVYLTHAGALWRDEAGAVQLAGLPRLGLTYWPSREWIPVFFVALVRAWSALGLGASDFSLRILGLLIGLSLLGVMWLNARLMGFRWPLISLGLLAANVTVVRWGDSLRAYGCGALFILLTLGLVWRLVQKPGIAAFLLASLAATLSVQSLYSNAFLVLAACLAGCAVCARHGKWKTVLLVLGVGLLPAASLLPYVPMIMATREYVALHQMGFSPNLLWGSLSAALGSGQHWPLWVWFGLSPLVCGVAWEALLGHGPDRTIGAEDLPWFGVSAIVAGMALFLVFLRISEYPAEPWYFLPLMVFGGAALDAALGRLLRRFGFWPPAIAALIVCAMFPTTLKLAKYRQTNVDLIAAELDRRAKPGDFVVVSPAYCGITFARYFKAQVAWTTLPPVEDHRTHRTDLVKTSLCSKPLLKSVLDQAARTLASGHTLWLAGGLSPPAPGETTPPELPPDPGPGQPFGYAEGCLRGYIWDRQMAHFLDTRPQTARLIRLEPATGVIPEENLPLLEATGWRRDPVTAAAPQ